MAGFALEDGLAAGVACAVAQGFALRISKSEPEP
jgi:hypothetical protein